MRCRLLISSLMFAAMVAGCSYPESAPEMDDYDYRARYPLSVESEVIAVTFRGGAGGLMTEQERYALNLIVADYKDRGQAPLTVVLGGSGLNNETLAEDIRSTAVDNGLAKSEVRVGASRRQCHDQLCQPYGRGARMRLLVSRVLHRVGKCQLGQLWLFFTTQPGAHACRSFGSDPTFRA